ncbi:MAG: hypothetical protein HYW25_04835 [Candidatus Aenigmarchaeota archaeon]|nr:hypothetical protein [Candidatus Aenigmarchaeota archaeon]
MVHRLGVLKEDQIVTKYRLDEVNGQRSKARGMVEWVGIREVPDTHVAISYNSWTKRYSAASRGKIIYVKTINDTGYIVNLAAARREKQDAEVEFKGLGRATMDISLFLRLDARKVLRGNPRYQAYARDSAKEVYNLTDIPRDVIDDDPDLQRFLVGFTRDFGETETGESQAVPSAEDRFIEHVNAMAKNYDVMDGKEQLPREVREKLPELNRELARELNLRIEAPRIIINLAEEDEAALSRRFQAEQEAAARRVLADADAYTAFTKAEADAKGVKENVERFLEGVGDKLTQDQRAQALGVFLGMKYIPQGTNLNRIEIPGLGNLGEFLKGFAK